MHTRAQVARVSLGATAMKLGLGPLRVALLPLPLALVLVTGAARASPRSSLYGANVREDALADGDVDADDLAIASPLAALATSGAGRPVLGAPRGSTWLSVVGFSRRTLDDRQELGAVLLVGLPLDRFGRGSTRATKLEVVAAKGALEVVPANAVQTPYELALTPRLARSCVDAAWRAAGLGSNDARLDGIMARARWSAVLPEARLRAVRFEDARLSLDTGTETSRLRDSAGANVGFEARLTWRLDRLLYADDEPSFERIRLEQRDARARIGGKVLEALFHWQRAALDLRTLPPSQQGTRDEAEVRLRLLEAEAALDVLTNGWFARQRARLAGAAYAAPVPLGRGGDGDL